MMRFILFLIVILAGFGFWWMKFASDDQKAAIDSKAPVSMVMDPVEGMIGNATGAPAADDGAAAPAAGDVSDDALVTDDSMADDAAADDMAADDMADDAAADDAAPADDAQPE